MNKSNLITGVIVGVIALVGGIALDGDVVTERVVEERTGVALPADYGGQLFLGGAFSQGGQVRSTSTSNTSETLLATDLLEYSVIDVTPNAGNLTLTLPATSTWTGPALIDDAGESRTWIIRNSATAATTTTIAAGTGIDLQEPDGQNVVIGQNNFAWLTCYRKADTDVVCLVDESIPAD